MILLAQWIERIFSAERRLVRMKDGGRLRAFFRPIQTQCSTAASHQYFFILWIRQLLEVLPPHSVFVSSGIHNLYFYWNIQVLQLQPLRWCCVDCVIHHERDVREEQKYVCVERASNNKRDCDVVALPILTCERLNMMTSVREERLQRMISCCLLSKCEALRICRSGFLIASQDNTVCSLPFRDEHGSGLDRTGSGLKPILAGSDWKIFVVSMWLL